MGCDVRPWESSEPGSDRITLTSLILLIAAGWEFNLREVRTEAGRPVRDCCNTPWERVSGGFQRTEP